MRKEPIQEGCENLCVAVVEQAVKDYKKALKTLRTDPNDIDATATVGECELFFREYADAWTDIPGKKIIEAVRERVNEDERKRRSRKNAGREPKKIKERNR